MSVFSVPVTIGVDEEKIAREIEANVEAKVVANITKEVKKQLFREDYYYGKKEDPEPLRNMIKTEIRRILDKNEDLIIKEAAKLLVEKMARTKAVKDAIAKTIEGEE